MPNKELTYILFTKGWDAMPVFYHLHQEGNKVIVGQVQDVSELHNGDATEDPEEKKERLSQYSGMMKIYPAKELMKSLLKIKDKENYCIIFDQNNLWYYSEILIKAGYTVGLFPTHEDFLLEKDRKSAMKFVSEHYKEIKTIPFTECKNTEEAIKFLESKSGIYVIQSEGDYVSTFVPQTDNEEASKVLSISQLNKFKKLYDKGSIILKQKLINPVEFTPQMVWLDGKRIYSNIDIENKNIGNGENIGPQCGCASNLIIATELEEKINKIAFPPITDELAAKHKGIYVFDISLYLHEGELFFGEYCPARYGFDSIMTEVSMGNTATDYFTSLLSGKNPLKKKFGTAIRLFNLNKKSEQVINYPDIEKNTWLYQVKMKDGEQVSVADCWDLGVLTSSGDTIEEAVSSLYENAKKFSFKEVYYRTEDDFNADYPTSIMNRYNAVNHKYFEAPDTKAVTELRGQLEQEYKGKMDVEIGKIKTLLKKAIYG